MNYYEVLENKVLKYDVYVNLEELINLRETIIKNCRLTEYIEVDATHLDDTNDKINVLNKVLVGYKDKSNQATNDLPIYHYSYEKYTYPYLITLIDEILKGNYSIITEILNPDEDKEIKYQETNELDKYLLQEINNMKKGPSTPIIKEFIRLTEKHLEYADINKKQQSAIDYYYLVSDLLKFNVIDTIMIEDIVRVQNFLNIDSNDIKKLTLSK